MNAFITIEGIEGVGKTTAIRFIQELFEFFELNYVMTREPGGTEIAEAIRQLILSHHVEHMSPDTELLLMFASRAQHIEKVIKPNLMAGKIVLSDRFTDATYAYQGGGRGLPEKRIAELEQWVQNGLKPDLTLLLDAPIEIGLKRMLSRGAKDRIEQEKIDFFHRVRACYLERAERFPDRFKVVDATQSLEMVQAQLRDALTSFLRLKSISKLA